MSDLRELYQEMILDHGMHPRNYMQMGDASCHADGHNPLCGDQISVYVKRDGDTISGVSFVGNGCAISKASASLMTEVLRNKTVAEAEKIFTLFHDLLTGKLADPKAHQAELGKLMVLAGVRDYPTRIKCASLAWHTLKSALESKSSIGPVQTE